MSGYERDKRQDEGEVGGGFHVVVGWECSGGWVLPAPALSELVPRKLLARVNCSLSCRTPPGILCLGHCKLLRAGKGPRALRQQNSTSEIYGSDDRGPQHYQNLQQLKTHKNVLKFI